MFVVGFFIPCVLCYPVIMFTAHLRVSVICSLFCLLSVSHWRLIFLCFLFHFLLFVASSPLSLSTCTTCPSACFLSSLGVRLSYVSLLYLLFFVYILSICSMFFILYKACWGSCRWGFCCAVGDWLQIVEPTGCPEIEHATPSTLDNHFWLQDNSTGQLVGQTASEKLPSICSHLQTNWEMLPIISLINKHKQIANCESVSADKRSLSAAHLIQLTACCFWSRFSSIYVILQLIVL